MPRRKRPYVPVSDVARRFVPITASQMRFARALEAEICKEHRVFWTQIAGSFRTPKIVLAREVVIRRLDAEGWTSQQIGVLLNKDHTTILHALGRTLRSQEMRRATAPKPTAEEVMQRIDKSRGSSVSTAMARVLVARLKELGVNYEEPVDEAA